MLFPNHAGPRQRQRVIVLGAGEIGLNVASRLTSENRQVVVVDHNPKKLQAVMAALDVQGLQGSASSPAILEEAGVASADIVVAVTGNDEVNLLACLIANVRNPGSLKLTRIKNGEYARMSDILGPDYLGVKAIINPDVEVVNTILRMLLIPTAVDYGEFGNGRVKVVAVEVKSGPLVDRPLTEFPAISQDRGVRVSGILRGERLVLPKGNDAIREGDVVYFACLEESLQTVLRITESGFKPIRSVCIVGGGDIGLRLAEILDKRDLRVKLVERNAARCEELAERLANVMVLNGDGTDRDFMRGENMGDSDIVVALTGDDETNILTCLLAKSIGTLNTITRVNKNGYMPIVRAIGLRLSVNPRVAATNSIVHFLRRGLLLSTLTTHDEDVEMLEAVLTDTSQQLGKPLKELHFPSGTNILAVLRWDDVFIPGGETVLQSGDRVILICERERLGWVDASLIGHR
ncbi:MAG: Trk system potassium transporter TrkA [Planctomycetaceae bacterium]|nr:Trk system potassium transporter TrkA [Planctomycetaceae bacterium]